MLKYPKVTIQGEDFMFDFNNKQLIDKKDNKIDLSDKKHIYMDAMKQIGALGEQTGAGAAGATTTATFQPAVGPGGSASKSGSFPGGNLKRHRKKLVRRDPPAIKEAIKFSNRLSNSSLGK